MRRPSEEHARDEHENKTAVGNCACEVSGQYAVFCVRNYVNSDSPMGEKDNSCYCILRLPDSFD